MAERRHTLEDPPNRGACSTRSSSKFTLVALGSPRARQINTYYNHLGEGLGTVVPPQVTSVSRKPLSIAFEEIAAGKVTYTGRTPRRRPPSPRPCRRRRGAGLLLEGAEVAPAAAERLRWPRAPR